jgi:hypothetical protein
VMLLLSRFEFVCDLLRDGKYERDDVVHAGILPREP